MSCHDRLLPLMMVGKRIDQKLIGNYMKKKHLALSQLIGKPETCYCYYSSADFHRLITLCTADDKASGLRMYFACLTYTGLPAVDAIARAGQDDMFTIIFAPTFYQDNYTITDLGSYFIINPIGGGVIQVTKKAASKLVERYNKFKKPLLETIINDAAGAAGRRETQSLWRELDAFTNADRGLLAEMDCQGASGITAFLGSYDKGETHPDPYGNDVPVEFQLTIIFDLAKEIDNAGDTYSYHFDIDDQDDYAAREQKTLEMVPYYGADTLNPCPPATTNCSNL